MGEHSPFRCSGYILSSLVAVYPEQRGSGRGSHVGLEQKQQLRCGAKAHLRSSDIHFTLYAQPALQGRIPIG